LKFAKWVLPLVLLALVSAQTKADDYSMQCKSGNQALNMLTDVIFVRPAGVVGLLAGSVLFVGLSPLTALANIPEPHNAFDRVGTVLVGIPYGYTFVRPLGYFPASC